MEATETMQMPVLGEGGEPCGECGAPLAADQRYCLNCGRRRTGPRVDYRAYLAPSGVEQSPPPPAESPTAGPPADRPEPGPAKPERDFAPLAAVGGIALLGLMLLVGVLIGKGGGDATNPAPQVIRVAGAGGETAAADSASGGSAAQAPSSKSGGKGGSGTGVKAVGGGLTGDAARQAKGTVQASEDDLEALQNTSGEDYEDAVKKLPDKIATPGAPPPIDKSKAPGGGDGGVTIE